MHINELKNKLSSIRENKVKTNIERRIESMGMQDYIFNVLVPEEVRYEKKKNGELKEVIENHFLDMYSLI